LNYYSQTEWILPLKITLMNWLFEYWTCESFQECNNELITWILNSLVVWKINIKLIFFFNIKPISRILGTTGGFYFPVINSLLHPWNDWQIQYSNNQFIKCNLDGYASLGLTVTSTLIAIVSENKTQYILSIWPTFHWFRAAHNSLNSLKPILPLRSRFTSVKNSK